MNLRWMIGWMAVVVTAGALRAAMTAGAAERLAARMKIGRASWRERVWT